MAAVLELIQRFTSAVGFTRPSTAVGSSNTDVQQIVELLNREGRDLSRRHSWQEITFEATFTTVATQSQGALSSFIGATQSIRKIVNNTIWNHTTRQQIMGPLNAQSWQRDQAVVTTGPYPQYRIRGNYLLMNPVPAAGDTCYFEYVSNCWCTSSDGATYRQNVAADTDLVLLDESLIMAGLEWRWLAKKGLPYSEEFQTYEQLVNRAIGDNGSKPVLDMAGVSDRRVYGRTIPEGDWPL